MLLLNPIRRISNLLAQFERTKEQLKAAAAECANARDQISDEIQALVVRDMELANAQMRATRAVEGIDNLLQGGSK